MTEATHTTHRVAARTLAALDSHHSHWVVAAVRFIALVFGFHEVESVVASVFERSHR
jgi:hypothetical protein